jgi:anti-sigma regulatory factor (Ser/Thr protein kinase)
MASAGVPSQLTADAVIAANEASTNSVEHAYRVGPAERVVLTASVEGAQVIVRVTDTGTWRPPPADPKFRGRGLPIIRSVSDVVDIDHDEAGTTVRMSIRLAPDPAFAGSVRVLGRSGR